MVAAVSPEQTASRTQRARSGKLSEHTAQSSEINWLREMTLEARRGAVAQILFHSETAQRDPANPGLRGAGRAH